MKVNYLWGNYSRRCFIGFVNEMYWESLYFVIGLVCVCVCRLCSIMYTRVMRKERMESVERRR